MLSFEEAAAEVRKLASKPYKPKSRFPTMSPEEARTRMNTASLDATRRKVPNQQRTKPLKPGETEDETLSDPYHELEEQAKALREKDPSLSESGAFTKVYLDPRNTDLVKREHRQRMAKIGAARR